MLGTGLGPGNSSIEMKELIIMHLPGQYHPKPFGRKNINVSQYHRWGLTLLSDLPPGVLQAIGFPENWPFLHHVLP